jgi:hypothetical protein
LDAPPRSAPAGDRVRIRALLLTGVTTAVVFGLLALFPDAKNGSPLRWSTPSKPEHYEKPFEWSQVCVERFFKFLCGDGLRYACGCGVFDRAITHRNSVAW